MLSVAEIVKATGLSSVVAEALLEGVTREGLEILLTGASGSAQAEVARMNAVGTCRAWGYVIPKTRGFYKIEGWEKKPERKTADQWDGKPREILNWVQSLSPVVSWDRPTISSRLARAPREYIAHENCFGYLWCYELARDQGWWYSVWDGIDGAGAIIIRRFPNMPRFRIFNLDMSAPDLLKLAEELAPASLVPVSILNCTPEIARGLKILDPKGSIMKRAEALYPTEEIANSPERFLNKRGMSHLRRSSADTILMLGRHDDEWRFHQRTVVETWKAVLEVRHRQLAITRDFVAIDGRFELNYLGWRQDLNVPVAANVLDRLPNRPDIAADLFNKSLNYTNMLGGRPGTSDWLLVRVCQDLAARGIQWYQAGGYDGGGAGLPDHKKRYATQSYNSRTFYTSFPHLTKESIRVESPVDN